jgi:hypothetical protein
MAMAINPKNIQETLIQRLYPTVVMWNRLEGRPRTHHFDKALKAEVRDALWMLTKQWQMGEFTADDAGSPVSAKVDIQISNLHKYKAANNDYQPLNNNEIPLEAKVEQKKISFERNNSKLSIDIRLKMGQYWLRLLRREGLNLESDYISKYSFQLPLKGRNTDQIYAHKDVWQKYSAISGRCMDGYHLYEEITKNNKKASANIVTSSTAQILLLDQLGDVFVEWFNKSFSEPEDETDSAWLPDRLEYQFECISESDIDEVTLDAEEYYNGHLDWYTFNIRSNDGIGTGLPKENLTDSFIPSHVEFDGMPDRRWWKFEDSKTSFGDIKPSTTDISKLLLIEFGLIFANDWFLIPLTLPIGSLAKIKGLTVTNNFGETYRIDSAERSNISNLEWSMYKLHSEDSNESLFLAPAAVKVQEGEPLEEILLIRDEMSNMVWGIEHIVPTLFGHGAQGNEYALQTRRYHEVLVSGNVVSIDVPYAANISYLAMTDVPENWIPFIPVHIDNHKRQIQLQRASMPRIIDGDTIAPTKIKPITSTLREGLENKPDALAYYIHEEEVSRAGIRVIQSFQRTRWINGEVLVWLGMKKKTGRGSGSSGLAFDQIKDVKIE